jgi:hypothetical protein
MGNHSGSGPEMQQSLRRSKMRGRFLISTAAAMVLGALAASAEAADEHAVRIGDQVRVTAPSVSPKTIQGSLAAVDRERLSVSTTAGTRVEVPRFRIAKLEVLRGSKSRWGIGALIGAGAGVLLGLVASNPPSSADHFQVDGGAVAVCGAVGAAGGALVGAVLRTDRWTTVPGDTVTLGIGPVSGRGVALAMRVSF